MKYRPVGHVVVRTPLCSLATLERMQRASSLSKAEGRRWLDELVQQPLVFEALTLAAPGLVAELDLWRAQPESERGQQVQRALVSYVIRLASRCTPFGLFAVLSLGTVGKRTHLEFTPNARLTRRTRLDMGYLQAVCDDVGARPETLARATLFANETVHRVGERLHFVSARMKGTERVYELQSVDALEVLTEVILPKARQGLGRAEAAALISEALDEVDDASAVEFVDQLIQVQLLRTDLQPPLTGHEALTALLPQFETLGAQLEHRILREVSGRLSSLDSASTSTPGVYRELAQQLEPLHVPIEPGKLVQVDAARLETGLEVSLGLATSLLSVAQQLTTIGPEGVDPLESFRAAFQARYEGAEVPLLEALDEESGVGFLDERAGHTAPLLEGLPFASSPTRQVAFDDDWYAWLTELRVRAEASPEREVVLSEAELNRRARRAPRLPESFTLHTVLLDAHGAKGPVAMYEGASGPSSENLLGRFAWLDERFEHATKVALRAEEALRPEALFAELVHSPQGRSGNVIARPVMRSAEIPILSRSGLPVDAHVQLDDLTLQVQGGRLVLRSRKLGKEVVPRLTNAHNHSVFGLPLYRFLAALQFEGPRWRADWSWGQLDAPFLPRVSIGRVIVARARWVLTATTLEKIHDVEALQALARTLGLPRFVRVREGDNTLAIDLEDAMSVECFRATYGRASRVVVEEDVLRLFGSAATMGREPLANEVHLPFVATERTTAAAKTFDHRRVLHAPGSDWLYMRLHVAPASADRLLVERIAPVVSEARSRGAIDRSFFIRYDEQGHHLRLRCHGEPTHLLGEVLPALMRAIEPEVKTGTVSRVLVDTYRPETERYGGTEGLALAEQWFDIDSASVIELLREYPRDAGLDARGWCALVGVLDTLELLLPEVSEQLQVLERWRSSLFDEFRGLQTTALETSLSKSSRARRQRIETLIQTRSDAQLDGGLRLLANRRQGLEPLAEAYRRLASSSAFTTSLGELAGAMMHMHVNRLLRAEQRKQELVLYDSLTRVLSSRQARARR